MLRTLESVIAILMILSIFLVFYQNLGPLPEFESTSWKIIGYNSLKGLDKTLQMRQEVITNNSTAIEGNLKKFIPATVNFTVRICDVSCPAPGISATSATESTGMVSVSYIVAGYRTHFAPRQVVLYMWPKS